MSGKRNKKGGKYKLQKEKKKFDKKKIKNLPTEHVNFDSEEIKKRKALIEKSKKQNKLLLDRIEE